MAAMLKQYFRENSEGIMSWENAWKEVSEDIKVAHLTHLTNFHSDIGYKIVFLSSAVAIFILYNNVPEMS